MPTLTILPSGKTAQIDTGTTLLAGITAAGESIKHTCTDSACSGLCHVFVPVGKKSLSKTQRTENETLDTIVGVGSKSRLACQARMGEEDVTVELLSALSG
jgi:2Fe-2S ferredoxin